MLIWTYGLSQSCNKPFSISFKEFSDTSVKISWTDTNEFPLGWEFELITRGNQRSGNPTTGLINTKEYVYSQLIPATAYEIYIRTQCQNNLNSGWNGPFLFSTVLNNPSNCQINLPIKDNGIEVFNINVNQSGLLGKDIFIESIDLIIQHDWPADLKITLESPSGQQTTLSNHRGTVTDDFGDINSMLCASVTSFSQNACMDIKSGKPPFIGSFKPDGNLSSLGVGTQAKGMWKLIFFDRALKDVGSLKYSNIKFNTQKCIVPENFAITQVNNNSAIIDWDAFVGCNTIKLLIFEVGKPVREIFINCNEPNFTIKDLAPNTMFNIAISSVCGSGNSLQSCILSFTTTCEEKSLIESFDSMANCFESCSEPCKLNSTTWFNAKDDSSQDWIIWKGRTDTESTGPNGDINDSGKYIYIESNPDLCGPMKSVILQSRCIDIKSNSSGCDMSFYYHMSGTDITSLRLQLSKDGGESWIGLFLAEGNQGNTWLRKTLSLSEYANTTAIFRFVAISASGVFGDLAIDQIEFYKSTLAVGLKKYYVDADSDGFGTETNSIEICTNITPIGYSLKKGDCNDNDPNIYPGATEIPCNNIDENCNGILDDIPIANPIKYTLTKHNETCNGASDGSIQIIISGGLPPYSIKWNNDSTGQALSNIKSGIFYAQITDESGCILQTEFIKIQADNTLSAIVTSIDKPSCFGKSDGKINIEHSNNSGPHTYIWSNGASTKNLSNIMEGQYHVTISDQNQCKTNLNNINVESKPAVLADLVLKKNASCFGQKNGSLELQAINGSPPYYFLWNNGMSTSGIQNLGSGNYTSTVTDNQGCKFVFKTTLTQPDSIVGKVISFENARCFGETNGSIKTNITGGVAPYTYLWNNFYNTNHIFNLGAGEYILRITDKNGCLSIMPKVTISQPDLFELNVDSLHASECRMGINGFISLNAKGGNLPYNFAWSHSEISTNKFDNLMSGNYNVTSYDVLGCKASLPNIFVPFINKPIVSLLNSLQQNACYMDSKAVIQANVLTGIPPFDYNWSHGVQYITQKKTDTLFNLPAGKYVLTITDANGCIGLSNELFFNELSIFSYTLDEVIKNTCSADTLGRISLKIIGGVVPIGIKWNKAGLTGTVINKLSNGKYIATASDANGCQFITEPIMLTSESEISIIDDILHAGVGLAIGKICVFPIGGIPSYSYKWSNGSTSNCIANLIAGTYSITINDALNCSFKKTYSIDNTSRTEDLAQNQLILYPNPSYDQLSIMSELLIEQISVYNSYGNLVEKESIHSKEYTADISRYKAGVYLIKIEFYGRNIWRKFIKID